MKGLGCRRFSVSDSVVCLIFLKFGNGVEKPFDVKFEAAAIAAGDAETGSFRRISIHRNRKRS